MPKIDKRRTFYSQLAVDLVFLTLLMAIFGWQMAMFRMYLNFIEQEMPLSRPQQSLLCLAP